MHNIPPPSRKVKSVNFTDAALFDFATKRADAQYGGNFSSYILALIERDRSQPEALRATSPFEDSLRSTISGFAGQAMAANAGYDYAIPHLNVLVQAKHRFPKERKLEYAMLGSLQNAATSNPGKDVILVYPDNLPPQEKERFSEVTALGNPALKALGASELKVFLGMKAADANGV